MPVEIILATKNLGKIEEFRRMGNSVLPYHLSPIPQNLEITWDETGETYEENALIKAYAVKAAMGCAYVLADDSGLSVDGLNGAPGIYSARYAGENATDADNRAKLLLALNDQTSRSAHFVCVLAFVHDGGVQYFEGRCRGKILTEERGSFGFGYDSLFIPDGYDKTFAELPQDVKNQISHRAVAFKAFNRACASFL